MYHILDDNLDDISFAFSMRLLVSDYQGPLVRLRRDSDNAELDFGCNDKDIVDVVAIDAWRGASDVYLVTWYDQSGLARNALQNNRNRQPQFFSDPTNPHFQGDGTNDRLDVNTSIQILTNAGINGTVLAVFNVDQNRASNIFGSTRNSNTADRWQSHTNWSDGRVYFDPGICCNTPRSYVNITNLDDWDSYSYIRTNTNVIARLNSIEQFNGTHTTGRCTATNNFGILYANGTNSLFSDTRVAEMIMYSTDINPSQYLEIEQNTINFWGL